MAKSSGKGNLEVLQSIDNDETCQTFVLKNEDHTLGNSLRYVIQKNPEVQFSGYSIPHPSENKINLRIQTRSQPATYVLRKGLTDLHNLCGHVLKTFENSVTDYKEKMAPK